MRLQMIIVWVGLSFLLQAAQSMPVTSISPSALVISNTRAVSTTEVAIKVGDIIVALPQSLGPGEQTSYPLPASGGCMVALIANFADKRTVGTVEFDACQNTKIRFTD